MLQVLHLTSGEGDFQARRCSAVLQRELSSDFPSTRRSIGRGGDYRNVAHAAVSLRAGWGPAVELVHAWDLRSFVAAVFAALPTVFSPAEPLTSRAARWLRLAAPRHSVHLVASTAAQREKWVRLGAAGERCHVIPPAVDGAQAVRRDERLRERLGFAGDDYVVLPLGESTGAAEHWRALWAVSILHVLDQRYRVLLWGRGRAVHRAIHLARRLGQEPLLVIAEQQLGRQVEFEELPGACDAGLIAGRGDLAMLPILSCMAGGLPLVAAQSDVTIELLRADHTALVESAGAPREMARAILRLREHPDLARGLARAALVDVADRFGARRYVDAMRRVYWAAGMTGGEPPVTSPTTMQAVASPTR